MFVKHIEEKNFLDYGLILSPLTRESFSKWNIDSTTISTYLQVWIVANSYQYIGATDVEGTIERGTIRNKQELAEIHYRFFVNQKKEFLRRQLKPTPSQNFGELLNLVSTASDEKIDDMIVKHLEATYEKA